MCLCFSRMGGSCSNSWLVCAFSCIWDGESLTESIKKHSWLFESDSLWWNMGISVVSTSWMRAYTGSREPQMACYVGHWRCERLQLGIYLNPHQLLDVSWDDHLLWDVLKFSTKPVREETILQSLIHSCFWYSSYSDKIWCKYISSIFCRSQPGY